MDIKSCYIGPEISPQQFIAEHYFLYLAMGTYIGYDGNSHAELHAGDFCLVRKNSLARYNKLMVNGEFKKVLIIFDEAFLKSFEEKYKPNKSTFNSKEVFIHPNKTGEIPKFIHSLMPHYIGAGQIDNQYAESKREELLRILLKNQPELSGLFFMYDNPYKINLEEFMNRNFKFNVSLERFAFLSGRSLSAFKRDFKIIFNETPSRWLTKKRLKEAHFLIEKKNKNPSDIYLDLGFEDLSHFSYAFKKTFGLTPTKLLAKKDGARR